MNPTNAAIRTLYARVIRLARSYGLDPDWQLVPGREKSASSARQPWTIHNGDLELFSLGFTRRGAYEALTTIATVFEYLITTDDWKEEEL